MVEATENQNAEQPLDETALQTELAVLVERNQLPQRIAQRISEKLKKNHLALTREQLSLLVERIQTALRSLQQPHDVEDEKNQVKTKPNQIPAAEDMKHLYDEVADLKDRLQVIELNSLEGIRGTAGRLVKTREIQNQSHIEVGQDALQSLEAIPNDPESIVIVMKWLSFMVERIGKHGLPDVLGYYVDIGWISDDVRLDLINYSKGIIEDLSHSDNQRETAYLPTKDHLQSLLFIQKLKGIHLDERFLNRIDREMEKMTKSLENTPTKPPL